MERLTKCICGYAHGAEGVSKDRLTDAYCRGEFEATACVEKLAEYEDLEEQGLLLKLPCKVGTKVYIPRKGIKKIIDGEVVSFHIGEFMSAANIFITDDNRYTEITFNNFGKILFLTQAEAEEVLKGMEGKEWKHMDI